MTDQLPRITLVTPTLNPGSFLEGAILSVLAQEYPNLEYVVMDGGSTDGTKSLLERYRSRLYYWQSQPDEGQGSAIVEGFRHGTGEILGWLNADDRLLPGALLTVGRFFSSCPQYDWVAGGCQILDEKERILRVVHPQGLDAKTLSLWPQTALCQPGVFWRRTLWEKVGGLDPSLECAMDFELWFRFAKEGHGAILSEVLSAAIEHKGMKTRRLAARSFVETCLVLDRHGFHDVARQKLERPIRRAFEVDRLLSVVTRNPLYRWWRERKEKRD